MLDPLTRTVMNIIKQFGGPATLTVKGDGVYDVETSTVISNDVSYPIKVAALDYIQKSNGLMTQAGGLIQTGDKQFFIQADAGLPVPRPGVDWILFEGRKWTVITLKDYNPSGSKSYCFEAYARA